jgi:hypothetical protein
MSVPCNETFKRCACGEEYTPESWRERPLAKKDIGFGPGLQIFEWGEIHETRQCKCGSHIIVVLDPGISEEEEIAIRPDLA